MDQMAQPQHVVEQYGNESRLETRTSVWQVPPGGRSPQDAAAAAVRSANPLQVLEIGCGTGGFAARLAAENPHATVIATDQSQRFAKLTSDRGLPAQVAAAQQLPFPDGHFDVVVAMWMLYHVPDLHQGLGEVRRVLREGGLFVAVTNGDAHLAALLTNAGGSPLLTQFSLENGAEVLKTHFAAVTQEDITTRAVFDNYERAVDYLASFDEALGAGLPYFEGSREDVGATALFLAR